MTHKQFQMVFLLFAIEGNKHLKPKPYYCSEEEALYHRGSFRENEVKSCLAEILYYSLQRV